MARGKSAYARQRGFSLIELSAIIGVAASVAVGAMEWLQAGAKTEAEKRVQTQERMNEIAEALVNFTITRNRLPCPADQLMRIDNTRESGGVTYDFGAEAMVIDSDTDGAGPDVARGMDCASSIGGIPVRALNLPPKYMEDAWGRRFTYIVSDNLCGNDASVGGLTTPQLPYVGCTPRDYKEGVNINLSPKVDTGNLTVSDGTTNMSTTAAFVLISHGTNGAGAYLPSGKRLANSATTSELENADDYTALDRLFVKRAFDSATATAFDDMVVYKTKEQITNLSYNYLEKVMSISECNANSTTLQSLTVAITNAMDTYIDDYRTSIGGGKYYNTGSQVGLGILWAVQEVCSHPDYYGVSASGTWLGKKCPGGASLVKTTNTNLCICNDGSWDGSC